LRFTNNDVRVRISEAARILGVSVDTLRRWEAAGKIKVECTPGGHRRYDLDQLRGIARNRPPDPSKRLTIGYARVSSRDQKDDLKRQVAVLSEFCARQGWMHEVIQDLGSGLNYNKKGLRLLIERICSGEVGRLVVTHKDRLLRFGSELVFALCEQFGTEVVIINRSENSSYEEDLVQDVWEIITVFSARLYGSRSHKNKQLVERLRDAAEEIAG
jgi:putative resolvase